MDVKPDSPASDCASPDVAGGGSKVLHFSLPKPAVSIPLKRRVEAPELSPAKPEEESAPHSPVAKAAEAASRPVAKPGEAASLVKAGDAASPVAKAGEAASPPATKADASPVTKAAEAASPPVKLPDSVGVPASDHRPLIEYLSKVLPLTEPVTAGDFQKFCLHSPETNALRWYALSSDISDSYMTEIMAKDLDLPMMPHEKLLIMPRAADLFVRWCQDQSTGWIPLFTSGGFFWAANYDPFEPLPAIIGVGGHQNFLDQRGRHDGRQRLEGVIIGRPEEPARGKQRNPPGTLILAPADEEVRRARHDEQLFMRHHGKVKILGNDFRHVGVGSVAAEGIPAERVGLRGMEAEFLKIHRSHRLRER